MTQHRTAQSAIQNLS